MRHAETVARSALEADQGRSHESLESQPGVVQKGDSGGPRYPQSGLELGEGEGYGLQVDTSPRSHRILTL